MTDSSNASQNIADYVVATLHAYGVRHVHAYPGASILPLMGAVHRHPEVTWITYRNEANAALAASAYAKLTGKVAVCAATAGPGASNLVTGLLDAQVDGARLLAITGMVDTWRQGRFEFQDIDAARLLGQFCSYSVSCSHPDELPSLLMECLGRADQRSCVTHLALPADIQKATLPKSSLYATRRPQPPRYPHPSDAVLDQAAGVLNGATSVVIAVGADARGTGPAIERLAEKLNAPILTAFNAKGVVAESHPNVIGVLGIFGSPGVEVSSQVLREADLVLAFGLRDLGSFVAAHSGMQTRRLVQCEPGADSLTHRFERESTVVGPLDQTAEALLGRVRPGNGELLALGRRLADTFFAQHAPPETPVSGVHPVRFLQALNDYLDESTVLALDTGDNAVWAAQFLRLNHRQDILVSENLGAMGFCQPALIAARLARPQARLVGIAGDGGVQMSIGELSVAIQHQLPFVLVVFKNGILGRIQAQEATPFEVEIHSPNFAELARAYGAEGAVVEAGTDINAVLETAFQPRKVPFLIEVRLDPDQMAPMGGWKDGFVPLHFS